MLMKLMGSSKMCAAILGVITANSNRVGLGLLPDISVVPGDMFTPQAETDGPCTHRLPSREKDKAPISHQTLNPEPQTLSPKPRFPVS